MEEKFESLISIIILNYNGGEIILECLESVFHSNYSKFEVIIIDNGSTDNSQKICKEKYPGIILIENNKNLGLGARNIGIDKSKGEFIVLLDSDTVVEKNWLKNFLISYNKHGDGLYQPKFLEKERPDIISSAGNMINIFGLSYSIGRGIKDENQFDDFRKVNYAPGACTFTKLKRIKEIGEIDNIFFAYHDDLDYGWRGLLLNIPSYYEPNSIVYHYGSPNLKWSSKKFFLLERNRWICLLTLYSTRTFLKILPSLILLEIGMTSFFILKGMLLAKILAFFSLIKLARSISKRKKRLQMKRKILDNEIIDSFVIDFHLQTDKIENIENTTIQNIVVKLSKFTKDILNY